MRIEKYHDHYIVVDAAGQFICSADTYNEALKEMEEMSCKQHFTSKVVQ